VFRVVWRADRERRVQSAAAAVVGLLLLCSGCATSLSDPPSADEADSDNDPAEGVNRAIFKANLAADHAVMRPVAQAYTDHVPEVVQTGVHNVVQNLKEPAVALNDLLQGNVKHAWQSVQRLAVNTTVGAVGVVDVAAKWGLPPHFVGGAPATYASVATGGANFVDVRAQHLHDLDELERNSLDYYATLRSVYRQHREAEITTAKEPEAQGRVDISIPDTNPVTAPPSADGK